MPSGQSWHAPVWAGAWRTIPIGAAVFGTHARLASIATGLAGMATVPAAGVRAVGVQKEQPVDDRTSGARRGHRDRYDETKKAKAGERAMHLGRLPLGGHGAEAANRRPRTRPRTASRIGRAARAS